MKVYHGKGTCSLGSLVLLEELGFDYDLVVLDLAGREQASPTYLKRNPKGKVPLLELDDGGYLSEWPAIAAYLCATKPEKGLLPADALGMARTLEAVDYIVSTLHMQGFTRMFRPGNFAPTEADHETVKARGKEIMEKGLALMDKALEGKDYIAGQFSVADAALFYVEFWAAARMKMVLPKNCAAHYERMKNRPAVKRVLEQEGLAQAA